MTFAEWVEKMNLLDDEEKAFVFAVIRSPGTKYPYSGISMRPEEGALPLWKKPEEHGLITCVGSWKWEATAISLKIPHRPCEED